MHHAGSSSLLTVVTAATIYQEKHHRIFAQQRSGSGVRVRVFKTRLSSLLILFLVALLVASGEAFSVSTRTRSLSDNRSRSTRLQMWLLSDLAEGYNGMLEAHPFVTASITAGCLSGLGDVIAQVQQEQQLDEYLSQSHVESSDSALLFPEYNRRKLLSIDMERLTRFILKGLGGGLIWLAWYHLADDLTQQLWCDDNNWFHLTEGSTGDGGNTIMTMGGGTEGVTVAPPTASIVTSTMVFRTLSSILLDQFLASPLVISFWEIPVPILLTPVDDRNNNNSKFQSIRTEVRGKLGPLLVENAKIWTVANMIIYNLPFEYRVLASSCTDVVWQSILSRNVNDVSVTTMATKNAEAAEYLSPSSTMVGLDYALQQDLEAALLPTTGSRGTSSGSSTMEEAIADVV